MGDRQQFKDFVFIGFDIRKVTGTHLAATKDRRRVLSVDQVVSERAPGLDAWESAGEYQSDWGLYRSFGPARDAILQIASNDKAQFEVLALFLHERSFQAAVAKGFLDCDASVALEIAEQNVKALAGYDVATLEYEWTSFLTNCGREISNYTNASEVNDALLLCSVERAQVLVAQADREIPEHAPFGIWGLWSTSA